MNPADVPQDLIVAAGHALMNAPGCDNDGVTELRHMLAAVLPLHEQQVRERIIAEQDAEYETEWGHQILRDDGTVGDQVPQADENSARFVVSLLMVDCVRNGDLPQVIRRRVRTDATPWEVADA